MLTVTCSSNGEAKMDKQILVSSTGKEKAEVKNPYHPPHLTEWGLITNLTKGGSGDVSDANGPFTSGSPLGPIRDPRIPLPPTPPAGG